MLGRSSNTNNKIKICEICTRKHFFFVSDQTSCAKTDTNTDIEMMNERINTCNHKKSYIYFLER